MIFTISPNLYAPPTDTLNTLKRPHTRLKKEADLRSASFQFNLKPSSKNNACYHSPVTIVCGSAQTYTPSSPLTYAGLKS